MVLEALEVPGWIIILAALFLSVINKIVHCFTKSTMNGPSSYKKLKQQVVLATVVVREVFHVVVTLT
jgi:hypothetical protein